MLQSKARTQAESKTAGRFPVRFFGPRRARSGVIALAVLAAIAGMIAINAHLLWVSVRSQTDCVPHLKAPGHAGQFRAAKPSC